MNNNHWLLLTLIFTFNLIAGDSSIVSLSIGNKYIYKGSRLCHGIPNPIQTSYTAEIISDTVINALTYRKFVCSGNLFWDNDTNVIFYRADSVRVFKFDLKKGVEDTVLNFTDTVGTQYSSGNYIVLKDERYILGKYFLFVQMSGLVSYASTLSLVNSFKGGLCEETIELKAAQVDSVKYGDTTLLSISNQQNFASKFQNYVLYQNYPNPFNPLTQISFYNPKEARMTLKVYDILGREIVNLVDGIIESGYHTIDFDGSFLHSGIYFYTLQSKNYFETKKLLLLK